MPTDKSVSDYQSVPNLRINMEKPNITSRAPTKTHQQLRAQSYSRSGSMSSLPKSVDHTPAKRSDVDPYKDSDSLPFVNVSRASGIRSSSLQSRLGNSKSVHIKAKQFVIDKETLELKKWEKIYE